MSPCVVTDAPHCAAAAAAAAAAVLHRASELALVPPMLGMSQQLLHRDHAATYYGGMPACSLTGKPLRRHGDEVARLAGGYYRALGRVDDTMNLGGIKVRCYTVV
jgi:acetyl-CoA synthetase